jgi:hypothetical protein
LSILVTFAIHAEPVESLRSALPGWYQRMVHGILSIARHREGRNDYGGLRTLNVESRSLKREPARPDLAGLMGTWTR